MLNIGRGKTRKRFTCYTIPHVMQFLNTANVVQQPTKVLIHVGTNDVETKKEPQLRKEVDNMIQLLRNTFPDARIFLSSIFVRKQKEDTLNNIIRTMNQYLEDFCDRTQRYTFMDNACISHNNMQDAKHVNPAGLHQFITNIRLAVFGERLNSSRKRGYR